MNNFKKVIISLFVFTILSSFTSGMEGADSESSKADTLGTSRALTTPFDCLSKMQPAISLQEQQERSFVIREVLRTIFDMANSERPIFVESLRKDYDNLRICYDFCMEAQHPAKPLFLLACWAMEQATSNQLRNKETVRAWLVPFLQKLQTMPGVDAHELQLIFLTEIFYIDQGTSRLTQEKANFKKFKKIAKFLKTMQRREIVAYYAIRLGRDIALAQEDPIPYYQIAADCGNKEALALIEKAKREKEQLQDLFKSFTQPKRSEKEAFNSSPDIGEKNGVIPSFLDEHDDKEIYGVLLEDSDQSSADSDRSKYVRRSTTLVEFSKKKVKK